MRLGRGELCRLCGGSAASACVRCGAALCIAHTPRADVRCDECEYGFMRSMETPLSRAWMAGLVALWPLAALIAEPAFRHAVIREDGAWATVTAVFFVVSMLAMSAAASFLMAGTVAQITRALYRTRFMRETTERVRVAHPYRGRIAVGARIETDTATMEVEPMAAREATR